MVIRVTNEFFEDRDKLKIFNCCLPMGLSLCPLHLQDVEVKREMQRRGGWWKYGMSKDKRGNITKAEGAGPRRENHSLPCMNQILNLH